MQGRTREAPFPIRLVKDLIDIGIWTVREAQVAAWSLSRPDHAAPACVFLSFKTCGALLPGSVGDIVKDAFNDAGLTGSGHRLRAYFATNLAMRLLEERLALNGHVYDQPVETWVLDHVAEALGHARITTTTRHYVDKALMRLLGKPTKPELTKAVQEHRAPLALPRGLGALGLTLVGKVVEALTRESGRGPLHDLLGSVLR